MHGECLSRRRLSIRKHRPTNALQDRLLDQILRNLLKNDARFRDGMVVDAVKVEGGGGDGVLEEVGDGVVGAGPWAGGVGGRLHSHHHPNIVIIPAFHFYKIL